MEEMETGLNNVAHELHYQIRRWISNNPLQINSEYFNLYMTQKSVEVED